MSTEELQRKYDKLFDLARKVRGAQIEYFRHRASSDLEKSKRYERELDHLLKEEIKDRESTQKKLF